MKNTLKMDISRFVKHKVKDQIRRPEKIEYIGGVGHWKGIFMDFSLYLHFLPSCVCICNRDYQ
jgi:hypothetical protein